MHLVSRSQEPQYPTALQRGYGVSIGNWNKKSEAVISVSTKVMFADVLKCGDPECKTHVYPSTAKTGG
jgi:hypothetical protein